MKYILLTLLVLLVCLILGIRLVSFFTRRHRILKGCLAGLLLVAVVAGAYCMVYYHADPLAGKALQGSETVTVQAIDQGWFFDGPGEKEALIFYPGAKVEAESYARLMLLLAEQGVDAFLIRMPLRMAFFDMQAAEPIQKAYAYESWYMAGHSLGGTTAALYTASHADRVAGLVLMAAYPTKALPVPLLTVYGSEDDCLSREAYEKSRDLWPEAATECVIEGGNHAQFGDYGVQRGDGAALIPAEEQQRQTAGAILAFVKGNADLS